jgi:nucleotide-binding universal stress UspA family protein
MPIVMGVHFNFTEFEAALLKEAKVKAQEFILRSGSTTVPIEAKVISGQPFSEICRVAEQEQAELIVLGSHGRTGVSHVLLGSVAERVVRHAHCPVLVVGKKAHASVSG